MTTKSLYTIALLPWIGLIVNVFSSLLGLGPIVRYNLLQQTEMFVVQVWGLLGVIVVLGHYFAEEDL